MLETKFCGVPSKYLQSDGIYLIAFYLFLLLLDSSRFWKIPESLFRPIQKLVLIYFYFLNKIRQKDKYPS